MASKIKIPAFFKKPVEVKKYEKTFLKKIYVVKDLEFIKTMVVTNAEGKIVLKDGITEEESKRLNKIADAVKKNSGAGLDMGKLILLGVVLVLVLVFNFTFKNKLVEWGLEKGLESVFNAKADVQSVDFDIPGARITFKSLTVANENEPMRNLFELGKTEIALNSEELLKAKFVAKNIECQGITWNTERKTSGALAGSPSRSQAGGQSGGTNEQGQDKKGDMDFSKINVNELLEKNKTNIKSVAVYSNANAQLVDMTNRWTKTVDDSKKNVAEATKKVDEVKKINVGAIKTVQEAQDVYNQIQSAAPVVESARTSVQTISRDFGADSAKVSASVNEAKGSVDKDYNYLLSLVQLPKGGVQGLAASLIEKILAEKLGKFYFYAQKARYYSSLLGGDKAGKKKKTPPNPGRRQGVTVAFPATVYPDFLIEKLAASGKDQASGFSVSADLKDMASDANLWGKPLVFHALQQGNGQSIAVNGFNDARSNAQNSFGLDFQAKNYPVQMTEGLGFLNARSFAAVAALSNGFVIPLAGGAKGQAFVLLTDVKLDLVNPDEMISRIFADSIKAMKKIEITVDYTIASNGAVQMGVKSNLDKEVANRAGKLLGDLAAKYQKEIKDWLAKQIEPELKKNEQLYAAYKKIEDVSKGNIKDVDSLKAELDKKQKEVDNRVNQLKKEAENKAKQEATKQLQDAGKKLPKLPGF